ncbi:hypothetical protein [Streptomyces sp. WAC01280]|uniref:hypothetical protein n=1 Tax=Streptomyces sp. WAC01280 TaxID=2487424 RepID=UPI000F77E718|nr:hypothetical protein [Streptomyces sp. WAC01280]RSS59797.1 hypothetical protein EF909_08020 [Streptomyces sp. WAC01280]
MPDTAPRPRFTRTTKIVTVLAVLILWTALASGWTDKGCNYIPQSYFLVLSHGTADSDEGCESEPSGPVYTDNYRR